MTARISMRQAVECDTEFARRAHHEAYRDVIIRQFGSFDDDLQNKFFIKSWDPAKYKIIIDDNREAGYYSVEYTHDHIFISELVILPQYQNKGIGTAILKMVMRDATSKNTPLRLQVLKENVAQSLYRRMGFVDVGMTDTHFILEFNPNR